MKKIYFGELTFYSNVGFILIHKIFVLLIIGYTIIQPYKFVCLTGEKNEC